MITDPKQDGDTRGALPDRLRTAAWLQYLIDRLDDAAGAADIAVHSRAGLSRDARAALHELAPWLATDGSGCACARDDACTHVPDAQQLAHAERCCPGSRAVYDSAHGVVDAWSFDDRETGWAALERIAQGVGNSDETAAHDAGHERGRAAVPPAKHLAEQRIAVAAAGAQPSTRPGALIDAVVLRICGPRDDASRIDEMAALATFCAALAAGDAISIAAYGGAHNLVARAIRTRRADLASVDGLLASLSVCRLERLVGAGSFWAYYLLAGIAIAAPGVVHAFGRRFHGDAWREWLDAVLASPAVGRFGPQEDAAFERLRGAMSLTSRRNPIVRAKRLRTRAVAIAPFGRDGVGTD
ncbi:hypothetical protein [Burkholderia pseudomultivorans]|uniref:Uncharacterized protein n=1 Tax=Burkholderia pseudomultivorans TaxID=1207504 RepID=A0A132EY23_9BURK|nr:hypothetical protein [Burkholderia pseudomultivorans]KWF62866.1 hypothetical protein WT57_23825 [Burkholderia pseudomultivorans]